MSDIETRVCSLVSKVLGVSAVTAESSLATDLAADSLDIIELIMATEDEFKIKIGDDDEDAIFVGTVGTLCELVDQKLAHRVATV